MAKGPPMDALAAICLIVGIVSTGIALGIAYIVWRRGEDRFRRLLDSLPILLDAFDEDGNIIVWNRACEQITGYSADEIISNPRAMELLYPDPIYRQKVWDASFDPAFTEGIWNLATKGGDVKTILWIETHQTHVMPGWAFWGMGVDITERVRAEESERQQRILAQTLQKTAAALIRTIDTQDTLTLIMDQLANVVPYDQALLLTLDGSTLNIVASRGLEQTAHTGYEMAGDSLPRTILNNAQPFVINDIRQYPNADQLPGILPTTCSWMAIPLITWGVVIGMLVVASRKVGHFNEHTLQAANAFAQQAAIALENVRMMTELSQTVFKLREAQARLARAARLSAAGEIATGVAHQINNPLTAIVAETSLLLRDLTPDHEHYQSVVTIRDAVHQAGSIVQRQLNLSRSVPYELASTDINDLLRSTASLIGVQMQSVARVVLDLADEIPTIMASPEHLADAWLNLMLNAKDALMGQEKGELRISTSLPVDEKVILITIQDNGPGIPQEHLDRIFDPFFTTKVRGHGLGLPIVYEIIRRHNGTININSREGMGTIVQITLPISELPNANRPRSADHGSHSDHR